MGEKMGPNTLAAFHAGADFMQAKLAAEEEDSSDDEALLAGAPGELRPGAHGRTTKTTGTKKPPPGALMVDPTAWRRLVVDASSDRWVLVSLDHPPNPKCETTLEALGRAYPSIEGAAASCGASRRVLRAWKASVLCLRSSATLEASCARGLLGGSSSIATARRRHDALLVEKRSWE